MLWGDSPNARLQLTYPVDRQDINELNGHGPALGMAVSAMSQTALALLRYQKGLSYDGSINILDSNHPNAWRLGGSVMTNPDDTEETERALTLAFRRPGSSYLDDEIEAIVETSKEQFDERVSSATGRTAIHLGRLSSYGEPGDVAERGKHINEVTPERVRQAVSALAKLAVRAQPYIHVTGPAQAVGEVDKLVELDRHSLVRKRTIPPVNINADGVFVLRIKLYSLHI